MQLPWESAVSASCWPLKATMSAPYFSADVFVVEGALDAADLLVLELLPALEAGLAVREHVDAGGVVARLDDADGFAPLVRHVHGGDHQVDLALLQELHAVRRDDRLDLELHAEPVGHVLGEVGLEADDGASRVAEAERLVVGLGADDEHAALLDLFERLRRERGPQRRPIQQ